MVLNRALRREYQAIWAARLRRKNATVPTTATVALLVGVDAAAIPEPVSFVY